MTPAPARCTRHAVLTDVARLMRDHDCGAIPVVETDATGSKLVGIITDRDIVVRGLADDIDPLRLTAGDCMTMVVATVTSGTSPSTNASIAVSNGALYIRTWEHLGCIREKKRGTDHPMIPTVS